MTAATPRTGRRYVSEASFQSAVTDLADLFGWLWFHDEDARRNHPGWPDLWLVKDGRLLAWELKAESGQPSSEQCELLEQLQAVQTVDCRLLKPSDWPAIEAELMR